LPQAAQVEVSMTEEVAQEVAQQAGQDQASEPQVNITESAQEYLGDLLSKQKDSEGMGIRMFVANPGSPQAETCIAYSRPGEEQDGDIEVEYAAFTAHFEGISIPYLEDAKVDYSADRMGGQLTIRAPNSKMPKINDDSPLEDRIKYVLYNDINPGLASHGGEVSLMEVTADMYAVLKFGGGCQGCSSVAMTLKDGVEVQLMDKIPEIKGVRDMTDHTDTSKAYM
jgi:Fe/S biogenesis protein NfuA